MQLKLFNCSRTARDRDREKIKRAINHSRRDPRRFYNERNIQITHNINKEEKKTLYLRHVANV